MATNKTFLDEENLLAFLGDTVQAVKIDEDPVELNEYRRIFRKAVPLTMRSYVAAYLIKQAQKGSGRGRRGFREDRYDRHNSRPRVSLDPDISTSLFISVGRKRRMFPRDIITLLMQGADIPRDHIGDIRILDNYSFVQVLIEDAERIIEKMNNSYYRGRTLLVSHSRKQDEDPSFINEAFDSDEEDDMSEMED